MSESEERIKEFILNNGLFTGQTSENDHRDRLMGLSSHTTLSQDMDTERKEAQRIPLSGDARTMVSFKGKYPTVGYPVTLITNGKEATAPDGHLSLSNGMVAKVAFGKFQGYLRRI